MTKIQELKYLITVSFLEKDIVTPEQAIDGQEIKDLLHNLAPAYLNWISEVKFNRYFLLALTGSTNFNDAEERTFLENPNKHYIKIVADRFTDPYIEQTYLQARYWAYNGNMKGWPFALGIDEATIKLLNEKHPLKPIEKLSDVKNDDDFWGFVNHWLEKNWRTV